MISRMGPKHIFNPDADEHMEMMREWEKREMNRDELIEAMVDAAALSKEQGTMHERMGAALDVVLKEYAIAIGQRSGHKPN